MIFFMWHGNNTRHLEIECCTDSGNVRFMKSFE